MNSGAAAGAKLIAVFYLIESSDPLDVFLSVKLLHTVPVTIILQLLSLKQQQLFNDLHIININIVRFLKELIT